MTPILPIPILPPESIEGIEFSIGRLEAELDYHRRRFGDAHSVRQGTARRVGTDVRCWTPGENTDRCQGNMMEKGEKEKIHEALEKAHGNRSLAATYLGITSEQLMFKIRECVDLNTIWGKGRSPAALTDVDTVSRGKIKAGVLISAEEDNVVAAMLLKEDVKLSKGLRELQLTQTEQEIGGALFRFNQKHFFKSMDIIGGGVTRAHLKLQSQLDELGARLQEVRALIRAGRSISGKHLAKSGDEPDKEGMAITIYDDLRASLVLEERFLMENFIQITDVMRRMFEAQSKTNQLLAGIRLKLMGKGGLDKDNMKRAKPGFVAQEAPQENEPA